jgi:hypothetical protein
VSVCVRHPSLLLLFPFLLLHRLFPLLLLLASFSSSPEKNEPASLQILCCKLIFCSHKPPTTTTTTVTFLSLLLLLLHLFVTSLSLSSSLHSCCLLPANLSCKSVLGVILQSWKWFVCLFVILLLVFAPRLPFWFW